jgi:hypothetical protein
MKKIDRNKEKIVKLLNENIDLYYKENIKKYVRVSEEVRSTGTKKEPKTSKVKIGHWFELFYDEDYPNDKKHACKIERKEIFEIDGERSYHWNKITYFTVNDI